MRASFSGPIAAEFRAWLRDAPGLTLYEGRSLLSSIDAACPDPDTREDGNCLWWMITGAIAARGE